MRLMTNPNLGEPNAHEENESCLKDGCVPVALKISSNVNEQYWNSCTASQRIFFLTRAVEGGIAKINEYSKVLWDQLPQPVREALALQNIKDYK